MSFITDSKEYQEKMEKLLKKSSVKNSYECCVNLITDTTLVYFLQHNYPDIWEEYMESQRGHKTINEIIEEITGGGIK